MVTWSSRVSPQAPQDFAGRNAGTDRVRGGNGASPSGWRRDGASRVGLLVIVAVAILLLVVPGIVGYQTEKIFTDALKQMSAQGTPVALESFERGWFSSSATTGFDFAGHHFRVRQTISHGLLPFQSGRLSPIPVAAVVDSRIDFPPELNDFLKRLFGDAEPVNIRTIVTLGGALHTHVSVPPCNAVDVVSPAGAYSEGTANSASVASDGFEGEFNLAGPNATVKWTLPALSVTASSRSFAIKSLSSDAESHEVSGVRLGAANFQVKSIEFNAGLPTGGSPMSVMVQDAAISASTNLKDAALQIDSNVTAASAEIPGLKMEKIRLRNEISNIDPTAMAQLLDVYRTLSVPPPNDPERAKQLGQKVLDQIAAIARHSPVVTLDLQASTAQGDARGNAKLGLKSDFAEDPALRTGTFDPTTVSYVLRSHSYASIDLRLPAPLPPELVNPVMAQQMVAMGVAVKDGSSYVTHATYDGGKLIVNGRQFF